MQSSDTATNVATYKRDRDWPRARGSISKVADIARAAREAVAAIPHEDGEPPSFSMTVEMPGVEDSFTSEAEFSAGVADYPLSRLGVTIIARSGWKAASEGSVVVYLGSGGASARMYVTGSDRRWVDGTAAIMREAMEGVALRPRSMRSKWVAALFVFAAEIVGLIAIFGDWAYGTAVAAVAGAAFALSAAYLLGTLGLLGRLLPRFRLVADGVEDPGVRGLRLVRRAAGAVLLLVAGAVVSALVSKWIN